MASVDVGRVEVGVFPEALGQAQRPAEEEDAVGLNLGSQDAQVEATRLSLGPADLGIHFGQGPR